MRRDGCERIVGGCVVVNGRAVVKIKWEGRRWNSRAVSWYITCHLTSLPFPFPTHLHLTSLSSPPFPTPSHPPPHLPSPTHLQQNKNKAVLSLCYARRKVPAIRSTTASTTAAPPSSAELPFPVPSSGGGDYVIARFSCLSGRAEVCPMDG